MKFPSPVSVHELARLTGSRVSGKVDSDVQGINEIHKVGNGDITFVDHPKYYDKALHSAATFIIINKETEAPPGKALLINDDPFSAYVTIVRKYRKFTPSKENIS